MTAGQFSPMRPRAGRGFVLAAAAAAALAAASGPARAQEDGISDNVLMEARVNAESKPQLLFVFSDGAAEDLAPRDAFTIDVSDDGTCAFDFDATPEFAGAPPAAVYGPASEQASINALKLPSYFSQLAANALLTSKLVEDQATAARFFNCTGLAWALILSEPPTAEE